MPGNRIRFLTASCAVVAALALLAARPDSAAVPPPQPGLWPVYDDVLAHATLRPTGHPNFPRLTSCRRRTHCDHWS